MKPAICSFLGTCEIYDKITSRLSTYILLVKSCFLKYVIRNKHNREYNYVKGQHAIGI